MTFCVSMCFGSGKLHQDAVHGGIGIELRDQRQQIGLRWCRRQHDARTTPCRLRDVIFSCCGHRLRSPDRCRPARPQAPASRRGRARALAPLPPPCRAGRAAMTLPSMTCAVMLVLVGPALSEPQFRFLQRVLRAASDRRRSAICLSRAVAPAPESTSRVARRPVALASSSHQRARLASPSFGDGADPRLQHAAAVCELSRCRRSHRCPPFGVSAHRDA